MLIHKVGELQLELHTLCARPRVESAIVYLAGVCMSCTVQSHGAFACSLIIQLVHARCGTHRVSSHSVSGVPSFFSCAPTVARALWGSSAAASCILFSDPHF